MVDKSDWPDGPWKDEPDRVDFIHAGYACFVKRHPRYGQWCGYVHKGQAEQLALPFCEPETAEQVGLFTASDAP